MRQFENVGEVFERLRRTSASFLQIKKLGRWSGLLLHSKKVSGLKPAWGLSVWSFCGFCSFFNPLYLKGKSGWWQYHKYFYKYAKTFMLFIPIILGHSREQLHMTVHNMSHHKIHICTVGEATWLPVIPLTLGEDRGMDLRSQTAAEITPKQFTCSTNFSWSFSPVSFHVFLFCWVHHLPDFAAWSCNCGSAWVDFRAQLLYFTSLSFHLDRRVFIWFNLISDGVSHFQKKDVHLTS